MSKPIILCDVDGVVADFAGAFAQLYEARTGEAVDRDAWHKTYDLWHGLGPASGRDEVRRAVTMEVGQPSFHRELLQPCAGAQEGIAALAELGEVWFVTRPWECAPEWTYEREQWLARHFGSVVQVPDHVIHARKKHLVHGDAFIDDMPENVLDWSKHRRGGVAVLWALPHNEGQHRGLIDLRTRSWADLADTLQRAFART